MQALRDVVRQTDRVNDHDRLVDAPPVTGGTEQAIREDAIRQERRRVSRELHDGIAQHLVSLGYLLDDLVSAEDPTTVAVTAGLAHEHAALIRADLVRIIDELRGRDVGAATVGADPDPGAALVAYADEIGRRHRLDIRVDRAESAAHRLPSATAAELVRIGREAITNVARHAAASTLWLSVVVDPPTVRVVVADDGTGVNAGHQRDRPAGHGLAIMAERAAQIGATVRLDDRPGGGTVVTISMGEEDHDGRARLSTARRRP